MSTYSRWREATKTKNDEIDALHLEIAEAKIEHVRLEGQRDALAEALKRATAYNVALARQLDDTTNLAEALLTYVTHEHTNASSAMPRMIPVGSWSEALVEHAVIYLGLDGNAVSPDDGR